MTHGQGYTRSDQCKTLDILLSATRGIPGVSGMEEGDEMLESYEALEVSEVVERRK